MELWKVLGDPKAAVEVMLSGKDTEDISAREIYFICAICPFLCETKKMEFERIFFVFLAEWLTFYGVKGKKRRKEK